jgi:hypothetical protein
MNLKNKIKSIRYNFLKKYSNRKLKSDITKYLRKTSTLESELKSALSFYETNEIQTFPYSFPHKYRTAQLEILKDEIAFYCLINQHKLYFKKDWSEESCKAYLKTLLIEQDPASPHAYCSEIFKPEPDEILVDIGTAEGYFTLLKLDEVKEVYAFEMDKKWNDVLKISFKNYFNKVKLFEGKLGNSNTNGNYKLDDFKELYKQKLFIKIDAEGSEYGVFDGMKTLLSQNNQIKIAVCTYHKKNDANEFEVYFKSLGFQTEFSNGYMLYRFAKDLSEPYLRKGVLRVWK